MSRSLSWSALAVAGLCLAAVGVALLPRGAPPMADDEAARWRARALEAEERIADLRERVHALESQRAIAPPARDETTAPPATESGPAPVAANRGAFAPGDANWNALVEGALQERARERLGHELEPEQLERLLPRLRELREAAVALEAPEGETPLRARLERSVLLMEADQALREELGMGMSELLGELDAGAVEEVETIDSASEHSDR